MSSFMRQVSSKEAWKRNSRRWVDGNGGGDGGTHIEYGAHMCMGMGMGMGMGMYDGTTTNESNSSMMMCSNNKKRVMVVVDESSRSKHAMMWALTHLTNKADWLTLLHVISPSSHSSSSSNAASTLATSLASLCKACKPEVEVEAIVIQGPKLATVLNQVKKLEASVLVLGQKKPSPIISCLFGASNTEGFVSECINKAECLTIGVRKQSKGMGGYLISTRWQKNFWLLA